MLTAPGPRARFCDFKGFKPYGRGDKAWDAGTAGDLTTIKITTGTTSVPSVGAPVRLQITHYCRRLQCLWKVMPRKPVRLPVLDSEMLTG